MTGVNQKIAEWICRRRFLSYHLKKSVVKKIYPNILRDHPFEIDFFGMKFSGNSGDHIGRMIYFCGAYEKYMLFFLRDYANALNSSDIFFVDVGANIGNHSLFMSKYVSQVYAFEPYDVVRNQLVNEISVNNINNIFVYPVGLSNREEKIPFYTPSGSNMGIGSFREDHNKENIFLANLQVVVGDEELKRQGIGRVDIIKIDVEGYEKYVLEGLRETINKFRPLIVLELSDSTRKKLSNFVEFRSLFPDNYAFQRFSIANKDSGKYEISPFDYEQNYKQKDIIACPDRKIKYLRNLA